MNDGAAWICLSLAAEGHDHHQKTEPNAYTLVLIGANAIAACATVSTNLYRVYTNFDVILSSA
jgi:hypothetical protein